MMPDPSIPRKRPYLLLPDSPAPGGPQTAPAKTGRPSSEPHFAVQLAWLEVDPKVCGTTPAGARAERAYDFEPAPGLAVPTPALEGLAARVETELLTAPAPTVNPSLPRRPNAHELAVAVVPSIVGAGLAWFVAGETGADPVTWTALGAAAGFLLGWGCLLWIRREG